MYHARIFEAILFVLLFDISVSLNYGEKITVKATYHDYLPDSPENTVACQLPMKVIDGVVRVTAANQAAGYDQSYGCGNCVKVTNKAPGGKTLTLMIIDEKGAEGLDIARSAFFALDNDAKDGQAAGQMQVDVENVACGDLVKNIKYRFKAGSNQWWFAISIVDHNLPVKTVALSLREEGPFYDCKRSGSINNYFDCNGIKSNLGGKFGLQMWIKVTAVTGEEIIDHLTKITSEDSPLDSPLGKQFGGGAGPTSSSKATTKGSTTTASSTTTKGSTSSASSSSVTTSKSSSTSTESSTTTKGSSSTTKGSSSSSSTTASSTTSKSTEAPSPCGDKFKCPSDGYHPDPCNCHKFYQCYGSRQWLKSCNGDLVWDSSISNCNFKWGAKDYVKDHCD